MEQRNDTLNYTADVERDEDGNIRKIFTHGTIEPEPSTDNLIKAMRVCYGHGSMRLCGNCPLRNDACADMEKFAADRLEQLERELLQKTQGLEATKTRHARKDAESAELYEKAIARAERAERERDAAINEAIMAVFYDMSDGKPALLLGEGI